MQVVVDRATERSEAGRNSPESGTLGGAQSFGVSASERDSPKVFAPGANLAAGMERQPGRSAAVAQFGRVGCLWAGQSFGLRRQASWLEVWRGAGANSARRNEHTSGTEAKCREMEAARLGHGNGAATKLGLRCSKIWTR